MTTTTTPKKTPLTPTKASKPSKPVSPAAAKTKVPVAKQAVKTAAPAKTPVKKTVVDSVKKAMTPWDLTQPADQEKFAEAIGSSMDVSGKKTLELCQQLHDAVEAYEGKKKEIRGVLRDKLKLTPNQFSRMEDIGAKADLFSGSATLPKAILSLKLLVKIGESDPALFEQITPHLSESTESSAIKHLASAVKAKDHEKVGMLEGVTKMGMKAFLSSPYSETDQVEKAVEPLLDALSSLLKVEINAKFPVDDPSNSTARKEAVNRSYTEGLLTLFLEFMGKMDTSNFIDLKQIEEQPGDLERFATEYLATKKAKLLSKEEARVQKLEKKAAKAQKKNAERAEKGTKEASTPKPN